MAISMPNFSQNFKAAAAAASVVSSSSTSQFNLNQPFLQQQQQQQENFMKFLNETMLMRAMISSQQQQQQQNFLNSPTQPFLTQNQSLFNPTNVSHLNSNGLTVTPTPSLQHQSHTSLRPLQNTELV